MQEGKVTHTFPFKDICSAGHSRAGSQIPICLKLTFRSIVFPPCSTEQSVQLGYDFSALCVSRKDAYLRYQKQGEEDK